MEVEHYLSGYEARRQKEMAGHRLTAHLIHSALAEKALTPSQFLPLPLVDGPLKTAPVAPDAADDYDDFKARLAAQNAQKQAK